MRLSFFLFFCSSLLESQQTGNCFLSAQVIKFKLCRCMKKKHKGHNNNDRGAVLSLDDVKRHVSRLTPSPPLMSHLLQQEGCTLTPAAGKESGGGWSVNRVRARRGGGISSKRQAQDGSGAPEGATAHLTLSVNGASSL